jgi:hypothetical protein
LDRHLPRGGLPGGAVVEVLCPADGAGATTVALHVARAAAGGARTVVIVDEAQDFYPPAAWSLGLAVGQLLVVRPATSKHAVWAIEQALRCPAVAAVIAAVARLETAASRCLQLAAEAGDTLGLLLRPSDRVQHSFAAVRLLVEPVPGGNVNPAELVPAARLCRVTLLKVREGMPEESFVIGLDDEASIGSVLSVPVDGPDSGETRRVIA